MIQGRGGPGLQRKRSSTTGFCATLGQELQRDQAMQPRVFGLVDHAHPAAAELFDDAVMRDGLADHKYRNPTSLDQQVNETGRARAGYASTAIDGYDMSALRNPICA